MIRRSRLFGGNWLPPPLLAIVCLTPMGDVSYADRWDKLLLHWESFLYYKIRDGIIAKCWLYSVTMRCTIAPKPHQMQILC